MDMGSIAAAATSLKAAADIAKALGELKSISDIQSKVIELQSKILAAQSSALSAQSEHMTMVQRVAELEKELALVKAWDRQKQRYKLTSPWSGCLVYALREDRKEADPPHWICTKCFEDGRKSIVNQVSDKNGWTMIVCPMCNSQMQSPWQGGIQPEYVSE